MESPNNQEAYNFSKKVDFSKRNSSYNVEVKAAMYNEPNSTDPTIEISGPHANQTNKSFNRPNQRILSNMRRPISDLVQTSEET